MISIALVFIILILNILLDLLDNTLSSMVYGQDVSQMVKWAIGHGPSWANMVKMVKTRVDISPYGQMKTGCLAKLVDCLSFVT